MFIKVLFFLLIIIDTQSTFLNFDKVISCYLLLSKHFWDLTFRSRGSDVPLQFLAGSFHLNAPQG